MAIPFTLISSDGKSFVVGEVVALQSVTIAGMIEYDCARRVITLPNVTSKILSMVIEYCMKHSTATDDGVLPAELFERYQKLVEYQLRNRNWDAEFVKVDLDTLYDLRKAAQYLNIPSLLDLIYRTFTDMWEGGRAEEMCAVLKAKVEEGMVFLEKDKWDLDSAIERGRAEEMCAVVKAKVEEVMVFVEKDKWDLDSAIERGRAEEMCAVVKAKVEEAMVFLEEDKWDLDSAIEKTEKSYLDSAIERTEMSY